MVALPANNRVRLVIKFFNGCDIGLVD